MFYPTGLETLVKEFYGEAGNVKGNRKKNKGADKGTGKDSKMGTSKLLKEGK